MLIICWVGPVPDQTPAVADGRIASSWSRRESDLFKTGSAWFAILGTHGR
jgi:hypothetical protein